MSLSEKLFYNFSRLFHCSIIKVLAICFRLESLIFPRKTDCFLCFRFVVSLPRQQILSYQIISCLSTLFLTFLFCFSKSLSRQRVISYQTVRRLSTPFFKFSFVFFKTALLCICSRFKFLCWILSQCRQEQFIYQYNKWGKNENPCLWIPHFPSFIHSPYLFYMITGNYRTIISRYTAITIFINFWFYWNGNFFCSRLTIIKC